MIELKSSVPAKQETNVFHQISLKKQSYYSKQHTSSFYIGILTNTLGEAKIKLVHIMKLIKKAQTKKNKDDYLIVIDNDVKLLSEVDFEEDINLLANG